jgi:hypothetical protein
VTVTIRWKVITSLARTVTKPADLSTLLFRAKASPSLYTDLSASLAYAYIPLWLDLQPTYFQTVIRELKAHGVDVGRTKFPFLIDLPEVGATQVTMTGRVFPPNILALSFKASLEISLDDPDRLGLLVDTLMPLRSLHSISPLVTIGSVTAGMVDSNSHKRYESNFKLPSHVAFEIADALPGEDPRGYIDHNRRSLVALLIGNSDYSEMSDDITTRIIDKNAEFNKKTDNEYLLINKQSILYLTATGYRRRGPHGHRLGRVLDLYELAMVGAHFLDDYQAIRRRSENFVDYILTRLQAWLESPEALLSLSATSTYIWKLLVEEFRLCEKLALLRSVNPGLPRRLEQRTQLFQELSGAWWKQAAYADAFDEDPDPGGEFDLSLVPDRNDRALLRRDYHEAVSSLSAQNYKATIILCGSLAEALLRIWLQRRNYLTSRDLNRGGLKDYLDAARAHESDGFVKDKSILDIVDKGLREWRNLVHPAVAVRKNLTVDEDKAAISLAAVRSLAKNLA